MHGTGGRLLMVAERPILELQEENLLRLDAQQVAGCQGFLGAYLLQRGCGHKLAV